MEAQRSTNFNEFYRSTGEHLVNIRAEECFDKVLYHVNSRILKCKMKNVITMHVVDVIFKLGSFKRKSHKVHMNNGPSKVLKKYAFGTKNLKNKQKLQLIWTYKNMSNLNHSKVSNY